MKKVTILGDGAWATTLAILLNKNGHKVTIWSVFPEYLDELNIKRENKKSSWFFNSERNIFCKRY